MRLAVLKYLDFLFERTNGFLALFYESFFPAVVGFYFLLFRCRQFVGLRSFQMVFPKCQIFLVTADGIFDGAGFKYSRK